MANRAKIYPDGATVETHIFLPGRVRNQLANHCADLGTNMNEWCGIVIRKALDEARGMPEPPPAAAPIPSRIDILRQYLTGETVLEPCGRSYPCERENHDSEFHGAVEFCGYCRIMIS